MIQRVKILIAKERVLIEVVSTRQTQEMGVTFRRKGEVLPYKLPLEEALRHPAVTIFIKVTTTTTAACHPHHMATMSDDH